MKIVEIPRDWPDIYREGQDTRWDILPFGTYQDLNLYHSIPNLLLEVLKRADD